MNQFIQPKKFLGQHFLKDLSVASAIADAVRGEQILEIGPGKGVLTQFLIRPDVTLKVVELDRECIPYLRQHFPLPDEHIIEANFLKMNLKNVFVGPFTLAGNFPYNISSQIVFKMLENKEQIPLMAGMFQKEVAERIAAGEGSKTYGILSILAGAWYDVEYLFTVPPEVFDPPPKVQSGVIRMVRKEIYPDCTETTLTRLVKTAFNQRRKTLQNTLKPLGGNARELIPAEMSALRPEQISIRDWIKLANIFDSGFRLP